MKFKLLLVAISFIPALVLAQQAPATPPPVTYSPPPSNTANSNKAIIPGTAPAPAKSVNADQVELQRIMDTYARQNEMIKKQIDEVTRKMQVTK